MDKGGGGIVDLFSALKISRLSALDSERTRPMGERCKEMVWHQWRSFQCSRKAKRDGYCTQHHPDSVAERARKAQERYEKEREASPWRQIKRLNEEITRLREALQFICDTDLDAEVHDQAADLRLVVRIAKKALDEDQTDDR